MAKANKGPYDPSPMPGSKDKLTSIIKSNGRMIDPRQEPCGDNKMTEREEY